MNRYGALFQLGGLLAALSWPLMASPLKSDEQVVFQTNTARLDEQGQLRVRVTAMVYEQERRPGFTSALAHYLDLDTAALNETERKLLYARTQLLRIDFERGKDLAVRVGDSTKHALRPSNKHGRSETELVLPPPLQYGGSGNQWLDFALAMPAGDERQFHGRALLLAATGLSIVSDIDDTIKDSNVRNRRELLLNTFARPFTAVAGMAMKYQLEARDSAGAAFHYVSGSPQQLYPALTGFLAEQGFPEGSLHLREIDLSDEVFGEGEGTVTHKKRIISRLIEDFPARRFVLIGDSGEHDPEIYGALARDFPIAIQSIWIRDVTGEPRQDPRYERAFRDLPSGHWQLFHDAGELVFAK